MKELAIGFVILLAAVIFVGGILGICVLYGSRRFSFQFKVGFTIVLVLATSYWIGFLILNT